MPYATAAVPERLIVLDLETTPDRERLPADWGTRFPKAIYHRVVCASVIEAEIERDADGFERYRITACRTGGEADWDEARLLEGFWRYLAGRPARVVGWNSRAFDTAVLLQRSLLHGLSAATWFRGITGRDGYRYRYSDQWHADVMDLLSEHGASTKLGLDEVARCCQLPGKLVAHGSEVEALVAEGRVAEVRAYCEIDCLNTFGVYLRYMLLTGRTSRAGYDEAIEHMADYLDRERSTRPHLGLFHEAWAISRTRLVPQIAA